MCKRGKEVFARKEVLREINGRFSGMSLRDVRFTARGFCEFGSCEFEICEFELASLTFCEFDLRI